MRYPAGKQLRLCRRLEIAALFERGRRANDHTLTLLATPNDLGLVRIGVAVGAKHGSAVARNRVKRLCREAGRLTRPELPSGWDFMLVPRAGKELTLDGLMKSLKTLAIRATGGGGG